MRVRVTSSTLVALYTWGAGGTQAELRAQSLSPTLSLTGTEPKPSSPPGQTGPRPPQWRRWQGLNHGDSVTKGKCSFYLGNLGRGWCRGDPYVLGRAWALGPH